MGLPGGQRRAADVARHGPSQNVGQRDFGLGTIKMPAAVVAAARCHVSDRPSYWYLVEFGGFGLPRKRIVSIVGAGGGCMSLLVERGSWTNLSAPANLPLLDEALDPLVPADVQDRSKMAAYLLHLVVLQEGLQIVLLDPAFWRMQSNPGVIQKWLTGTEKNPQALHALCREWTVTKEKDRVTFCFNVMNGWGGVERWTVHLRVEKAVRLEGFQVQPARKDDTFSNETGYVTNLAHA